MAVSGYLENAEGIGGVMGLLRACDGGLGGMEEELLGFQVCGYWL
jgi:hypothetical protein